MHATASVAQMRVVACICRQAWDPHLDLPHALFFQEPKLSNRGLLAQTLIIHRMRPARLLLTLDL